MTDPAILPSPHTTDTQTRCGFVALIGTPNAGKSTLLNRLLGQKISIVSPKVQTTRARVLGILTEASSQIILTDTPGLFQPKRRLDRAMVAAAWGGAADADIVVLLVDIADNRAVADSLILAEKLKQAQRRSVLALNKIDKIKREELLTLSQKLTDAGDFAAVFMISAQKGSGVEDLKNWLARHIPAGVWHYDEDTVTDMPMRLLSAELTREQTFLKLHDELPYQLTVETEHWETLPDGSARIDQTIYVARDGQKAIVIGAGGRTIKAIGTAARKAISEAYGGTVHLKLFVKVREDWQEDPERYKPWGLDFKS